MSPPKLLGSKVKKDLQMFVDEFRKLFSAMGASSEE